MRAAHGARLLGGRTPARAISIPSAKHQGAQAAAAVATGLARKRGAHAAIVRGVPREQEDLVARLAQEVQLEALKLQSSEPSAGSSPAPHATPSQHLAPGTQLLGGKYTIVRVLGTGSSATTYQAMSSETGGSVAVKALSLRAARDWKQLTLFQREAQMLQALNHPGIPRYVDYFEVDTPTDRAFYLVQEEVVGKSLAQMVAEGARCSTDEASRITVALCEVLGYLSSLHPPVVHRDVKPENIVLEGGQWDGRVFLVDFGSVAGVAVAAQGEHESFMSTVVGTYGYMAPEQFRGAAQPASDAYALGATLLLLLSGRPPSTFPQERMRINWRGSTSGLPAGLQAPSRVWEVVLDGLLEPVAEDRLTPRQALDLLTGRAASLATWAGSGVRQGPAPARARALGTAKVLSAKLTGRILKAAREQQEEVDAEAAEGALQAVLGKGPTARLGAGALAAALQRAADSDDDGSDGEDSDRGLGGTTRPARRGPAARLQARGGRSKQAARGRAGAGAGEDNIDGVEPLEDELDAELMARTLQMQGAQDKDDFAEEEVSPEDEVALAAFMAPGASSFKQLSLSDLILSKLREQQAARGLDVMPEDGHSEGERPMPEGLDDKVVAVYRGVGKLLSRYTVGKVPKAFKIIPNLKEWEEILWLTEPDFWSPQAMYEATKLFVSSLNARLAQRFLALVLLPRVRRDIKQHQKLHFALFMALRKATYKPGAFYKGILLPLCASRTCSLREAVILSSVLKRTSIPVLHSAAALMRMAELEYCGTTSFFMRVLLDKKYALPYRVIDGLVEHFVRFADDERSLPVVWHQALLCFVQRYKDEVRPQDKEALRKLCQAQSHYLVTPEVLRELDHSRGQMGVAAKTGPQPMAFTAAGASSLSTWANGANFVMGSGVQGVAGATMAPAGAGRVFGVAPFAVPAQSVMGKNVSENVRSMPPVMMLDMVDC